MQTRTGRHQQQPKKWDKAGNSIRAPREGASDGRGGGGSGGGAPDRSAQLRVQVDRFNSATGRRIRDDKERAPAKTGIAVGTSGRRDEKVNGYHENR